MRLKPNIRPRPRIEMLPLIDIVFLLLVFFIYAMLSMAVHRGMDVNLPGSAQAERTEETLLSLAVKTTPTGLELYLNKRPVLLKHLEADLRQAALQLADQSMPEMSLFADKSVSYQQLYQVLDSINSAGIGKISLQAVAEKP